MHYISLHLLDAIPHVDKSQLAGRFLSSTHFYHDGQWAKYFDADGAIHALNAWPAEATYYSATLEKESDLLLHFMNVMAQRACYSELEKPISGMIDDVFNLTGAIAKIEHFHATRGMLRGGATRLVATEVEYIFTLCRSMFDLLQEIASKLWYKTVLRDEQAQKERKKKKKFEETFSKVVFSAKGFKTVEELVDAFGIPIPWAEFYVLHAPFFNMVRNYRDGIVHHGSQVDLVTESDSGFLVRKTHKPFSEMPWLDEEELDNDVCLLMPALGYIILHTLAACENFTIMLETTIGLPPPVVPGKYFIIRGYFNDGFKAFIDAAKERRLKLG